MNWLDGFYAKHPEYRYVPIARRTRGSVHFRLAPDLYEAHYLSFPAFERLADGRRIPASKLTAGLRLMQGMLHSPRALARFALLLPFGTTFTDGAGGDVSTYVDAWLNRAGDGADATYNYGADTVLQIQAGGTWAFNALLKFDVSSIPDSASISAGTLYTYDRGLNAGATFTIDIYRILAANSGWIEGTKSGTQAGSGEPCWNAKAANGSGGITTAWAGDTGADGGADAGCGVSGTDYNATAAGTLSGTVGAVGTEHSASLDTSQLTTMLTTDNGLILIGASTSNYIAFCSSDFGTTGYRPKLVIVYTTGGGVSPAVFAPSNTLIGGGI